MTNDLKLNLSFDDNRYLEAVDPEVITWERVLEICGSWDVQALYAAVAGLILSGMTMYYFLRWREYVENEKLRWFLDKFTFTMLMLLWVIVIVRMVRGA